MIYRPHDRHLWVMTDVGTCSLLLSLYICIYLPTTKLVKMKQFLSLCFLVLLVVCLLVPPANG